MVTWIASYPRSGNTWVRIFLAYYHGWKDPKELGPFGYGDISEWAYSRVAPVPNPFDEFWSYALKPAALFQLIWYLEGIEDRIWLKTHAANVVIDGWIQIPEQLITNVIYLVRDPRDVAVSFAAYRGDDLDSTINHMHNERFTLIGDRGIRQGVSSWRRHIESWHKHPNGISIKYEDLFTDGFEQILEFLGLPIDERYVQAKEATLFSRLQSLEQKEGFIPNAENVMFRAGRVGDYEKALSETQIDFITEHNYDLMKEFQYL